MYKLTQTLATGTTRKKNDRFVQLAIAHANSVRRMLKCKTLASLHWWDERMTNDFN